MTGQWQEREPLRRVPALLLLVWSAGCGQYTTPPSPRPFPTSPPAPTATPWPTPGPILNYFEINFPQFKTEYNHVKEQNLQKLTQRYQEVLPMFSEGEEEQLRKITGQILTGTLTNVSDDGVLVE